MRARKVLSKVFAVLSALIFLFGLLIFVCVLKAGRGQVPSVLGYSVLRVETGSMEPTIETGSVVIIKKTDPSQLKVGDIISFYSVGEVISGRVNTHRITKITRLMPSGDLQFATKGDANAEEDPDLVFHTSVIGRLVFNIGVFSGSVLNVLRNRYVIFFLIILPLIVITFSEAVNLVNLFIKPDGPEDDDSNEKITDGQSGEEKDN